jgi:hypothetical protein
VQRRERTIVFAAAAIGARKRTVIPKDAPFRRTSVVRGGDRSSPTIPVGRRPRGIRVSPEGRTLFVALSGSPLAPPGVDRDALLPADKATFNVPTFTEAYNYAAYDGLQRLAERLRTRDGRPRRTIVSDPPAPRYLVSAQDNLGRISQLNPVLGRQCGGVMGPDELAQLSANRLSGEPVPEDLKLLCAHHEHLHDRFGIILEWRPHWAPWLDTSYLSAAEQQDPDIVANLRATEDVCRLIAFVAASEDSEFIGYWRGPQGRTVAESPLVVLDNEGQFELCAGRTCAEAILARAGRFEEMRDWLRSIGIALVWESESDVTWPEDTHDPHKLHWDLYDRYVGTGGPTRS